MGALGWVLLFSVPLLVHAAWDSPGPLVVDASAGAGIQASLAVVAGNPAISYLDNTNGTLKYARATDATGTTWVSMTVDDSAVVGAYTSLEVVAGNPAISYYDSTNGALKYARATDATGTTWVSMTVDNSVADVGEHTSLAVVNGNPAMSYYDGTNGALKFARATDITGTAWVSTIVDNSADVGEYTSLAVISGTPAISYIDGTNTTLKYARATDAAGTTWVSMTVDDGSIILMGTSLAVVGGNPAISYYDNLNGALKYARATDATGTAWTLMTVDDGPSSTALGGSSSLMVVNGNPAIGYWAYWSFTSNGVKYARATDATGTAWVSTTVDSGDLYFGQGPSLAVVDNHPAISYWGGTFDDGLRYVRSDNPNSVVLRDAATRPVREGGARLAVGIVTAVALGGLAASWKVWCRRITR
ncbi:MAG: hypothetical protein JW918_17695 [Anaerolineae bacterium]|nr:hypothetical protein [Anaerolineae bacterium]